MRADFYTKEGFRKLSKWLFCIVLICAVSMGQSGFADVSARANELEIHFIDVGQADAILVKGPNNQNILIDAGNNADGDLVVKYLKQQGIKSFKALVGTHPHEDHIGGLDTVINSFEFDSIYMPKVSHNTKTFKDVLVAVQKKGKKVSTAVKGVTIPVKGFSATFMEPSRGSYEDLNHYSAVLRISYGGHSFLLMGDAEAINERDMMKNFPPSLLKADLIKIGHHGSKSSSTKVFLEAVKPAYAVIPVGKNNDYGHPHKETTTLLTRMNIKCYRTDVDGTVIARSDGKTLRLDASKSAAKPNTTNSSNGKVYVDKNGKGLIKGNINSKKEKIYHMPGGAYYDRTIAEEWFKTEEEAQKAGYRKSQR